jgi:NAD(P)-dependent dehydrogenase (short-subunit alcohol dehydrogenase family)
VVLTGETHGLAPRAYWGGFAVGKSALPALAAIWSEELEHAGHPRVNVLVPGPIASPQRAQSHPAKTPRSSARRNTRCPPSFSSSVLTAPASAEKPSTCDPCNARRRRQSVKLGIGRKSVRKSLH